MLIPIIMKFLERLILQHMKSASNITLQFVYCSKCYTKEIGTFALHSALSHLERITPYVMMLFLDFSSALNT